MKLQKLYALITSIVLISMLSVHGMEPNNNDMHPLLCLPLEVQQQIVFPWYTDDIKINPKKMDQLKEVVKTFFVFNIVSKYFNQNLKLPWSHLELVKKNEMLEGITDYMAVLTYEKYRTVPLALVYSGANADTKDEFWHTCLDTAVMEDDESAVAMLLEHNANPYQEDRWSTPICFHARTFGLIHLFLKKIDKDKLLSKSKRVVWVLASSLHSSDIMAFWLDYGVNPRYLDYNNHCNDFCILHNLASSIYDHSNTVDNVLAKGELLLKHIPDMVNMVNTQGETPLDLVRQHVIFCKTHADWVEKITTLFRKHGGKTAQELAAENIQ